MNRNKIIKNAEILLSDLGFSDCSDSDEKSYKLNINTYSDDFIEIRFGGDYFGLNIGEFLFEIISLDNDGIWVEDISGMYFDTIEEVIGVIFSNFDCFDRFEEKYNINLDDDADTDDLKDKCFCDYCDDFIPTSECETIDVNDDFEVACSECYNNLYKDNK